MPMIDLEKLTEGRVRNLTGHERGVEARRTFGLDAYDAGSEPIDVRVPDNLEAITGSFFQGMFAQSVRVADGDFLERYRFHASPAIMEQVLRGIEKVNTKRGMALA